MSGRFAEPVATSEAAVQWLDSPQAYEPAPASVTHLETHISHVFIAGDFVYKLKKAVKYDFLDFSTLAAREHACREEIRLNRRLAKDIYLDVVPIGQSSDGQFHVSGPGKVVDWLVKMRRLPAAKMLDAMHRAGTLRPDHIDSLAELLVRFYAERSPVAMTAETYRQRCLTHVQRNRDDLLVTTHLLPKLVVQRVHAFQLQLLRLQQEFFARRVQDGRVVEGHGDLRAEHICLDDPIAIFDCIEFNEEFRQLDVADELAFLDAECDFIGADWIGPRLWQRYCQLSGDHPPPVLIDFYKSYRASVRAKVAALRANQVSGSARELAVNDALAHLSLANKYAAPHQRPLVLIVGGLSGSGKTTVARKLAEVLSTELLRSDVIRQDLYGVSGKTAAESTIRYRPEARQHVYEEMFRRTASLHQQHVAVVLDATFSNAAQVRDACALAVAPRALFLAIECRCPSAVARQRIAQRAAQGGDASEAGLEVLEQQRRLWEPWPADIPQIKLETEQPLANQVQTVLAELARRRTAGDEISV